MGGFLQTFSFLNIPTIHIFILLFVPIYIYYLFIHINSYLSSSYLYKLPKLLHPTIVNYQLNFKKKTHTKHSLKGWKPK